MSYLLLLGLGIGIVFLLGNILYIFVTIVRQQYGWAIAHAVVAIIVAFSFMSNWDSYQEYEKELSEINTQSHMVRMIVTFSKIDILTKERITEVLMDNYEIPYVCSLMTVFGSYESDRIEPRTGNWIDVECLNAITDEQIPYMTKDDLFPKDTKFDYDIGPALDDFLNGQKT